MKYIYWTINTHLNLFHLFLSIIAKVSFFVSPRRKVLKLIDFLYPEPPHTIEILDQSGRAYLTSSDGVVVVGPINQDEHISLVCRVQGGGWYGGGGPINQEDKISLVSWCMEVGVV